MNSLEELKQQLLLQKQAIESKGGYVNVLGSNPSPAEITAGIKSIPTVATASTLNLHNLNVNTNAEINTLQTQTEQPNQPNNIV